MSLSLREGIVIIVDIDWYFADRDALHIYLIYELTRILHAIHREVDLVDDVPPEHTVPIMCVCQVCS